jgi:type IV secretion system protein TrbL
VEPLDPGILTKLLHTFTFVFTGGYATLAPEAMWLLQTLALLEFTLFALYMALGAEDAIAGLMTKLMWICAFIFLVTVWPTLTKIIVDSFMQVGLQAGSGGARLFTVMEFTNPSSIARFGLEVTGNIFRYLNSISGMIWGVRNPHIVLISGFAAMAIVMAYFLIAIQIFICMLEFYLVSTLALILVPWGIFRHSAFLAERAFGLIIAFGIKLMVLGCIVAAMQPALVTLQIPEAPELNDIFSLLLASIALAMLAWHAPSVAAGMMSGAPSLTASTAAHTVVASAATVGLAGVASLGAVRAATAAGRGFARTAGAITQAYSTEGGWAGVRRLGEAVAVDSLATVSRGYRTALAQGRVYSIVRLNQQPGGGGLANYGFSAGRPRPGGGGMGAVRMVQRIVPPPSPPAGGINAPLSRP